MVEHVFRKWWIFALRGVLAIALGVIMAFLPHVTLLLLLAVFATYAFIDGFFAVVLGVASFGGGGRRWLWFVLEGFAGIAFALVFLYYPRATALALLYFVALWAIVTGIIEIILGWQSQQQAGLGLRLAAAGGVSIALGVLIYAEPMLGAAAIVWIVAAYAITFGWIQLGMAFRLRGRHFAEAPE